MTAVFNRYVLLYLALVGTAQLATANVILAFPSATIGTLLLIAYYFSVLIGAPVQGHVSDNYHRKLTLIFAFVVLSATQLALWYFGARCLAILSVNACLFGLWGNGDVIARAALFDLPAGEAKSSERVDRLKMGLSFAVLAPPWILASLVRQWDPSGSWNFGIAGAAGIIASVLSAFSLGKSERGKHPKIRPIKSLLRANRLWKFLVTIVLLQTAYQTVFLWQDKAAGHPFSFVTQENLVATSLFTICAIAQAFLPFGNSFVARGAIIAGILALTLASIFSYVASGAEMLQAVTGFGLISAAAGLYLPRLFLQQSQSFSEHEHGAVFGLLEASWVLGEMAAALAILTSASKVVPVFAAMLMIFAYLVLRATTSRSL